MDLTTRIFRDLAEVARWAFQSTKCDPGKYSLADVIRDKDGYFAVRNDFLQWQSLPSCAERVDESGDIVRLSYNNGANVYEFRVSCVFAILREYKRIATTDITAKERNELCTMAKQGEERGELIAIVEMPKALTKQVAKAAGKDHVRRMLDGLYVDAGGYIVATDGHILNMCKAVVVSCEKDFTGELLPTDFAKRSDGQTVEIYRDGLHAYARCGDDVATCENGKYPNWRRVLPNVSEKGRMQVSAKVIKKALKNMDAEITLSSHDGHISMSCDGMHKDVEGKGCADFSGAYRTANLTSIMQPCTSAYVTASGRPSAFIGDGVLSLVMPTDQYSNYDFVGGQNDLANVLDLMEVAEPEPKTRGREKAQKAEPSAPEEEKPNESNYTEDVQTEASEAIHNESEPANDMPGCPRTITTTTTNRILLPSSALKYKIGIFVHVATIVDARREYGGVTACITHKAYRQFTRGSTISFCTTGEKGGNIRIINHYPGELYCRG